MTAYNSAWEHLQEELALLDLRIAVLVESRQSQGGGQDELGPFRGLVISEAEVGRLLARDQSGEWPANILAVLEQAQSQMERRRQETLAAGIRLPLAEAAARFGLGPVERLALVAALAVELDRRYEKLYGYLQDDVTRRRPTADLVLELAGLGGAERLAGRLRFLARGPLLRHGLLTTREDPSLPVGSRPLELDPEMIAFLAGQLSPAATVRADPAAARAVMGSERFARLAERLAAGGPIAIILTGPPGSGRRTVAATLCQELGRPLRELDLRQLTAEPELAAALRSACRDARLAGGALCVHGLEAWAGQEARPLRLLAELAAEGGLPLFFTTTAAWRSGGLLRPLPVVQAEVQMPDYSQSVRLWSGLLGESSPHPDTLASRFRLSPGKLLDAWQTAGEWAALAGRDGAPDLADLLHACRVHSNPGLISLATPLTPRAGWDRLVLAPKALTQLQEFCARMAHRHRVYTDWGFGGGHSRGLGFSALFSGASGTGKTLAAEVIAGELGMDAYKIDLSAVVSKYVGETEKNLEKVFREAENSNVLLFFDEADALFGRRTEVRDAHDRYANIEINYLLQRMEQYDGMVILATNRADHLDEAFKRRLAFHIPFPMPDEAARRRIWEVHLPSPAPRAAGLDLDFLARRLPLAGGNIRNIALGAAFLAAAAGEPIGMAHLARAAARELEKMGRQATETELGPYYALVRGMDS